MSGKVSRPGPFALALRVVALGSGCALTACPPTDDYFIRPDAQAAPSTSGSGGAGVSTGATGGSLGTSAGSGAMAGDATDLGGTSGIDAGGFAGEGAGTGNVAGGAGTAGTAGTAGAPCQVECNAGRVCDTECQTGWVSTAAPPGGFSPRERAASVSLGNQLFVWGGLNESGTPLSSGALYDPRTDSWHMVSTEGSPSPRCDATAVWTGSVVIVLGGLEPSGPTVYADGAIDDPVDDTWQPMAPASTPRAAAIGVATSTVVLFWAGNDEAGDTLAGLELYDPDADTWEIADNRSEPSRRTDPSWAAGDRTFWVFGGRGGTGASDAALYYSLGSDSWSARSNPTLSPRWGGFGAFVNGRFHVWGGRDIDNVFDDGMYYDSLRFREMPGQTMPSARYASRGESGWSWAVDDHLFMVLGGLSGPGNYLTDGGIYDTDRAQWSDIEAWPSGASHAFGAVGRAAGEIVVWGGRDGALLTNSGVRYLP